jgi:hypothetical protein
MATPSEPITNNHITPEDAAYKALAQYAGSINEYFQEDITESDTRAKFIDVFLRDVLGWQESNIRRELTYWSEGEKAAIDYVMAINSKGQVINPASQF